MGPGAYNGNEGAMGAMGAKAKGQPEKK